LEPHRYNYFLIIPFEQHLVIFVAAAAVVPKGILPAASIREKPLPALPTEAST
jgi:hypothetical protein